MDRIECQWCKAQNEMGRTNCTTCGAPLDKKDLVTDSGWAEAPRLRDMTEFRFSRVELLSSRWVTILLWPGRRRFRSSVKSSTANGMPGGTPSMMTILPGPWLSPAVVMRNACPKELPAIN